MIPAKPVKSDPILSYEATTPFFKDFVCLRDQLLASLNTDASKSHYNGFTLAHKHLFKLKLVADAQPYIDQLRDYGLNERVTIALVTLYSIMETTPKEREAATCSGPTIRLIKFLAEENQTNPLIVSSALFAIRNMVCSMFEKQYRPFNSFGLSSTNPLSSSKPLKLEVFGKSVDTINAAAAEETANEAKKFEAGKGMVAYHDAHKMHSLFKSWPAIESRIHSLMLRLMEPAEWVDAAEIHLEIAKELKKKDFTKLGKVQYLHLQRVLDLSINPATKKYSRPFASLEGEGDRVDWEKVYNDGKPLTHQVPVELATPKEFRIVRDGWAYVSESELPEIVSRYYEREIAQEMFEMCRVISRQPRLHHETLPPKFHGILFSYDHEIVFYNNIVGLLKSDQLTVGNRLVRGDGKLACTIPLLWSNLGKLPMCLRLMLLRFRSKNQAYKLNNPERTSFITLLCHAGVSEQEVVLFFQTFYLGTEIALGTENMRQTIRNIYKNMAIPAKALKPPACQNLAERGMCPFATKSRTRGAGVASLDIEDAFDLVREGFVDSPAASTFEWPKDDPDHVFNPFLLPTTTPLEKCRMHMELVLNPTPVRPTLGFKSPLGAMAANPALRK